MKVTIHYSIQQNIKKSGRCQKNYKYGLRVRRKAWEGCTKPATCKYSFTDCITLSIIIFPLQGVPLEPHHESFFQAFSILEDFLVGIILILTVLIVTVFQYFVELRYIGNMSPLSCVTEVKRQLYRVLQGPQKRCSLVTCSDQQFYEGQNLSPGAGVTSMDLLGRSDGSIPSS